ncbi:hypothetical protein MM236_00835 [Belliella sp. DSM 107340]|uniref:Uncharacterized protein n=1 Tax=Belliella calami TaxID=2923436 RepID=A0ABS9UK14_9BACT|nr:hypothetical protein [Belliella calami]MCH7396505.1 hypothetical protein [Belliella calami]
MKNTINKISSINKSIFSFGSNADSYSTGAYIYNQGSVNTPFFHSAKIKQIHNSISDEGIKRSHLNKKFIKYYTDFKEQFEKHIESFSEIEFEFAQEEMTKSLNFLLTFDPDKMSLELTFDCCIYYTFLKGNYTVYISHFLDLEEYDYEEITFAVFNNDDKLPSFAGDFESFKIAFSNLMVYKPELEFHY